MSSRPARTTGARRASGLVAASVAGLVALVPASAGAFDRAAAIARALESAPEASADAVARSESDALEEAAGGALNNPRLSFEAAGDGFGPIDADERAFRLGLAQELDVHGRSGARRDVARAEGELTAASVVERETALATRTAEAFGALLLARRRAVLADSIAGASTRLVAAAREAARRETISPYTLRVLTRDETRLADEALRARGAAAAAEAALRALLLASADEPLALDDDLDAAPWTCAPETLTARALDAHPALREARANERQREAEADLAAREGQANTEFELFVLQERDRVGADAFGPPLEGTPGFDGFESTSTMFGAGVTVTLPFARTNAWESGRARLSTLRAAAQRRRIEAGIEPAIAAACATLAAAQERVALHDAAVVEVGADGERLATAYREGRVDLDAYLAQRDRLAAALTARLDALADTESARIDLARASGLDPVTLAAVVDGAAQGDSR